MTISYVATKMNPCDIVTNLAEPLENQILTGTLINMRGSGSPFRDYSLFIPFVDPWGR